MATKRAIQVDILAAIFAIGSWVCIQGLWVELPLIVPALPEGWALPSILSVLITIANIGPISFTILNYAAPNYVTEKRGIYLIILIGCASTGLLALYWKATAVIFGHERSVALFALVFFLGMVDCSSRVLYVPFMSKFQETYLVSYFVGEGLSGFLPGAFALLQGVGGSPECHPISLTDNSTLHLVYQPPVFSVEVFFCFLLGMFITSAVAFHLLNYDAIVFKALLSDPDPVKYLTSEVKGSENGHGLSAVMVEVSLNSLENGTTTTTQENKNGMPAPSTDNELFYYLAGVQLIVCLVSNGFLMSIQTFSCLPYGNLVYHLSVTLSMMANPIVCLFLELPIPGPSRGSINIGCILSTLFSAYVTMTALSSPTPPLLDQISGKILIVFCWVGLISTFTYVKVSTATLLKRVAGKRGLFWFGAMTQVGSAIGAIGTFGLVNYTTVFKSYSPCQQSEGVTAHG